MTSTIGWSKNKPRNGRSEGNNFSTFRTCMSVIDDPFWLSILESSSKGRLPEGFIWVCKERRLVYDDGNDRSEYVITRDKNEAAYEIIDIFEYHGVTAPKSPSISPNITTYREIRGHNINIMLKIFFNNQVKKNQLDRSQQRKLLILIAQLMLRGALNDSNVIIKNGVIDRITCIDFQDGNYVTVD